MQAPISVNSSTREHPTFSHAVEKARKHAIQISPTWLQDARSYLDDPKNNDFLEKAIKLKNGKNYVVLEKGDTGLNFRIEYYGPGEAFARCKKNIANGNFRICSFHVDLYSRDAFGKLKIIVVPKNGNPKIELENAKRYLSEKKVDFAPNELMREEELLSEKELAENQLKDLSEILKYRKFEKYTKLYAGKTITKYGVYTEIQDGTGNTIPPEYKADCARAFIQGIAKINNLGFVFNDISLGNLLYSVENGKISIKLIDLQFVRRLTSNECYFAGTLLMTPTEIFNVVLTKPRPLPQGKDIPKYNLLKDGWSLGVSILEIFDEVFNEFPVLDSDTVFSIYEKRLPTIQSLQLTRPSQIPQDIYEAIKALTTQNIDTRSTAAAVAKLS